MFKSSFFFPLDFTTKTILDELTLGGATEVLRILRWHMTLLDLDKNLNMKTKWNVGNITIPWLNVLERLRRMLLKLKKEKGNASIYKNMIHPTNNDEFEPPSNLVFR